MSLSRPQPPADQPGWYRDPENPRLHRYWTGAAWRDTWVYDAATAEDGVLTEVAEPGGREAER